MKKIQETKKIKALLMKIKLRKVNGTKRFTFTTTQLLKNKTVEVVGVQDRDHGQYHIVFYNKTDKKFYGTLTKPASEIEGSKNVVLQKESK